MAVVGKTTLRKNELKNYFGQEVINLLETIYPRDAKAHIVDSMPDEDLQRINDMATEEGQDALIQVCQEQNITEFDYTNMTPHDLATMVFHKNMWGFLSAENLCNVDSINKFSDYKGEKAIQPDYAALDFMKAELSGYFSAQGRGGVVEIEKYASSDRITHFIKYGDKIKDFSVLESNGFKNRKLRLSKEATIIYYPSRKSLRIHASSENLKGFLVKSFARYILKDEDYFANHEKAVYYDLKKVYLLNEFAKRFNPDEIENVSLRELTVKHTSENRSKITFSGLDVLLQIAETRADLNSYMPVKVKISFTLKGYGRQNRRTIEISIPNTSNLNDTPRDHLIMKYLMEWGIVVID